METPDVWRWVFFFFFFYIGPPTTPLCSTISKKKKPSVCVFDRSIWYSILTFLWKCNWRSPRDVRFPAAVTSQFCFEFWQRLFVCLCSLFSPSRRVPFCAFAGCYLWSRRGSSIMKSSGRINSQVITATYFFFLSKQGVLTTPLPLRVTSKVTCLDGYFLWKDAVVLIILLPISTRRFRWTKSSGGVIG